MRQTIDSAAAALGGSILAGGQGMPCEYGEKIADLAVELGDLRLMELADFPESAKLLEVTVVGSPATKNLCLLPQYHIKVVQKFIECSNIKIDGLISSTSGGGLTVSGWLPGAVFGLPIADAVCNTRSTPDGFGPMSLNLPEDYESIQMAVGGDPANKTYIEAMIRGSLFTTSQIVRQLALEAGGAIYVAKNPVTVKHVKKYAAIGYVSQAIDLGKSVLACFDDVPARLNAICGFLRGSVILIGHVTKFNIKTKGIFDNGIALVESGKESCSIHFQNLYTEVRRGGITVAKFPDLIIVISMRTGMPAASFQLEAEHEVAVIVVPHNRQT